MVRGDIFVILRPRRQGLHGHRGTHSSARRETHGHVLSVCRARFLLGFALAPRKTLAGFWGGMPDAQEEKDGKSFQSKSFNARGSFKGALEEIDVNDSRWYIHEPFTNRELLEEAASHFSQYDPEAWIPTLTARMTPFIFYPWAAITIMITLITLFVETHREYISDFSFSTDAHVIMGGALSFLVVFRTNSSYDRWWEARCAWQTTITTCRTMGAMLAPSMVTEEARESMVMQIMAFVLALKAFVRDEKISFEELGERMDRKHIEVLNKSSCAPLMAIRIMAHTARLNLPADDPKATDNPNARLGAVLYEEGIIFFRTLATQMGVMERIKETPMVFGYVARGPIRADRPQPITAAATVPRTPPPPASLDYPRPLTTPSSRVQVATLRFFLMLWLVTLPVSLIGCASITITITIVVAVVVVVASGGGSNSIAARNDSQQEQHRRWWWSWWSC